jgi:uncharacterized protein
MTAEATKVGQSPGGLGRLGLGVGLDMPWGARVGFTGEGRTRGKVTDPVRRFMQREMVGFAYSFFSFQPRDFGALEASRYFDAYDDFCALAGDRPRVFHHTRLNIGCPDRFHKAEVATFTNALIDRYRFSWIVEDLGIWIFRGKALPYPLPPLLTVAGRERCIEHATEWRNLISAPISIEFPGFSEGGTFFLGAEHAFDYYTAVVRAADMLATIDIGHILSYLWIKGVHGKNIIGELSRLPLERCIEFHLSGCQIANGKFRDLHHGILLDEQLELLEMLIPLCPNLVGITYEDPVFDSGGALAPKTVPNYLRLRGIASQWSTHA